MKNIVPTLFSFLFLYFFAFSFELDAQECDCYNSTRSKGVQLMQEKKYSDALKYFTAAEDCPDKPTSNDLNVKKEDCKRAIL